MDDKQDGATSDEAILDAVREQYGAVARSQLSNDAPAVRTVAEAFGYTPEDLASLPPQANLGLSCGNPVALAGLRPGEVVVDLGSGGGLDVFLAARRVGPTGKAIGIDLTAEMIERARAGAAESGLTNVEFHLACIDALPLPDISVDCILSNCVINLVPDKHRAFREILRVLKPGGRIALSDIALRQILPAAIREQAQAYVGCISGALQISEYERLLRDAGFEGVIVQETGADLNAYAQLGTTGCCSTGQCGSAAGADDPFPAVHAGLADLFQQFDVNDYASSVRVYARKPGGPITLNQVQEQPSMKSIVVYDKPLCCATGVCGPQVDPVLPRFAADLEWIQGQGHTVERYNLAQQPQAFLQNAAIHQLLAERGVDVLPVVVVDGEIVSRQHYPSREMLAAWVGLAPRSEGLPVEQRPAGSCCGKSGCC